MAKLFRILDPFYLLMLGIGIGGIIACGVFAAPVIFRIGEFLPIITQSDSGLIMGKIFMRLNGYLQILLIVIAVYEFLGLIDRENNPAYSFMWFLLGLASIVLIALFAWHYTPFILEPQNIESENFAIMHEQSVVVFKALMGTLSVLFVWRIYKLRGR